jgi:RNA polymerase sigma-70 factor (ECF subfamily)
MLNPQHGVRPQSVSSSLEDRNGWLAGEAHDDTDGATAGQMPTDGASPPTERLAFEAIVQQYQTRIARYILRLVHDPELALDLTQDTFVSAFRSIHNLRSDLALSAWLYRIATNIAVQARRRNARIHWESLTGVENSSIAATAAPDGLVIDRDSVTMALAQMPRERAACLLLHAKEGFSYEEVAVIVGSTPEAVRKRISRAKEQFRAIYDASCEERHGRRSR